MAKVDKLISKIEDEKLRLEIKKEINKINENKKFGLVFEEHVPEYTVLYEVPIKIGSTVKINDCKSEDLFYVINIVDDKARLIYKYKEYKDTLEINIDNLVAVTEFGDPIYPYLEKIDSIEGNPDSDLFHILIESDNYHALQLLDYVFRGKVDCIYIDPPYNSLDKQWKYNNHYVDINDSYKHSKWLSYMEKRLKLAKKLLNPKDSVLIVTIDEKEYLHLGMLLEDIFPGARIQMISTVINPKGSARDFGFSRAEEYIYYVFIGESSITPTNYDMLRPKQENSRQVRWASLQRSGSDSRRFETPKMFYPIFFNISDDSFHSVGKTLDLEEKRESIKAPKGTYAIFPLGQNLDERRWQLSQKTFLERLKLGYVKFGPYNKERGTRAIYYLSNGIIAQIESGDIEIVGKETDGSVILSMVQKVRPMSIWNSPLHSASEYGSSLLQNFMGDRKFPFPKSLYAVHDTLKFVVGNKPEAIILDFFAGSGTTQHAVNLLNYEDGGKRQCIMVTNNELSNSEEVQLKSEGYKPGDAEWEKIGISRYITWPRIVSSITGKDIKGNPVKGEYITNKVSKKIKKRTFKQIGFIDYDNLQKATSKKQLLSIIGKGELPQSLVKGDRQYIVPEDEKFKSTILFDDRCASEWIEELKDKAFLENIYIVTKKTATYNKIKTMVEESLDDLLREEQTTIPISQGLKTNAIYFKVGFVDKISVALGQQLQKLISILWMKAGSIGKCPEINENINNYYIFKYNSMAILVNEDSFGDFYQDLNNYEGIETIFIVTDSNLGYKEMIRSFKGKRTFQLYRDYLDNFKINIRRN